MNTVGDDLYQSLVVLNWSFSPCTVSLRKLCTLTLFHRGQCVDRSIAYSFWWLSSQLLSLKHWLSNFTARQSADRKVCRLDRSTEPFPTAVSTVLSTANRLSDGGKQVTHASRASRQECRENVHSSSNISRGERWRLRRTNGGINSGLRPESQWVEWSVGDPSVNWDSSS